MSSNRMEDSEAVQVTGKIMIVTIIALFVVVIFFFFLHLYSKWYWSRRHEGQQSSGVTVLRCGLDVSFLETIPVLTFDSNKFKDGLECAVCLSQVEDGEKTRILPKCNHAFHMECIDMWFHSHSTCPICRHHVSSGEIQISLDQTPATDSSSGDSTNLLFWGDETQVTSAAAPSSSTRPDLAIDIPRQIEENNEDEKTPVSSRMGTLRRILSGSSRFIPFTPPGNSSNVDQVYKDSSS